jgi:hypothetical protein
LYEVNCGNAAEIPEPDGTNALTPLRSGLVNDAVDTVITLIEPEVAANEAENLVCKRYISSSCGS